MIIRISILLFFCISPYFYKSYSQEAYHLQDTSIAEKYYSKGDSLSRSGRYDSANVYFEKAKDIYDFVNEKNTDQNICRKLISCSNGIGWNYIMLAKYESADKLMEETLNYGLEKLGENNIEVAQTYHVIGVLSWAKEDYMTSIKYHEKALSIKQQLSGSQNTKISASYDNLGINYDEIGDYDKALEYYQKELEIDLQAKEIDQLSLAKTYNNIGNAYLDKGDYYKALEYHQKALSIRQSVLDENHPYIASSYDNIGIVYAQEKEYAKALDYFKKALAIRIKAFGESHPLVASTLNHIGNSYYYLHDYDDALEYCQKSLDLERTFAKGQYHSFLNIYTNLGKIYKEKGDPGSAIFYLNKTAELGTQLYGEKNIYTGIAFKRLAEVYELNKDYREALSYCQKGLISLVQTFNNDSIYANPELTAIISETELLNILKLKAKIFKELSDQTGKEDLLASLNTYRAVCDLIDQMRTGYRAEGTKIFLGEQTEDIFDQAIKVSIELYEKTREENFKNQAFDFLEKRKAAVLEENLSEVKAERFSGIPDSLLKREKQLKITLTFYETALYKMYQKKELKDSIRAAEYENNLFDLKNQFDQLISGFEKNYPGYYNLKYQTKTISFEEIQKSIAFNTALLDYFEGDSLIYIFVITKNDFNIFSEKKGDDFSGLVRDFYSAVVKAETEPFISYSNKLSSMLIMPVLSKIKDMENLVIIPDDELFKVPFETLCSELIKPGQADLSKISYLIKSFNISYHYSASLYMSGLSDNKFTESSRDDDKKFIGFAPVFSKYDNDAGRLKNNYVSASGRDSGRMNNQAADNDTKINELKYSEHEVKSVAGLFSKTNTNSSDTSYVHVDATEDLFKKEIKNYKIIHIATHSYVNELQPELSAVLFAQPRDSSASEDGILYAGEIYNLDIKAHLVVLSSCESGLGKLIKGEGMMALNRGFLYAGASNVIFSLWKIPDLQTSELMIEFYKQMLTGKSYSESLRQAKLELISKPSSSRPRSWAGFVLIGPG